MNPVTDELVRIQYHAGRRDFTELTIVGANGGAADFSNTQLTGCDFSSSSIVGAQFQRAELRSVFFAYAELTGANFNGADLEGAVFAGASVPRSSFNGAILVNVDLRGDFEFSAFSSEALGGGPSFDEACSWPEHPAAFTGATLDQQPFWPTVAFYHQVGPILAAAERARYIDLAAVHASRMDATLAAVRGEGSFGR